MNIQLPDGNVRHPFFVPSAGASSSNDEVRAIVRYAHGNFSLGKLCCKTRT